MKMRIWIGIMFWVLLFSSFSLQAQTVEKAAVKLGNGATVKNTIIWNNDGNALTGGKSPISSFIKNDTLSEKPGFINAAIGDFRLKATSSCIDVGADDDLLGNKDLGGNPRKNGTVDIGAYEYTTYKVRFKKSEFVAVITEDEKGIEYDSTSVEPGGTFVFKLNLNIANINVTEVKRVLIDGSNVVIPIVGSYYKIDNINSDVTIIIELDPSITIEVEPVENGSLTIETGGVTIPGNNEDKWQNVMNVADGTHITIDTVSKTGYYCENVWVEDFVGRAGKQDAMEWVGKSTYEVTERVKFSAKFSIRDFPVITEWDQERGAVVVSSDDASTTSPQTKLYPWKTKLTINITPKPNYNLEYCKITIIDDGKLISSNVDKIQEIDVRLGGIRIEVKFSKPKHIVKWSTIIGGSLEVRDGSEPLTSGTGVEEGTRLDVTPKPNEGYQLKSGTFNVFPLGKPSQSLEGVESWIVNEDARFAAEFEKKKFNVTFTKDPLLVSENFWKTPTIDTVVEYKDALLVHAESGVGYRCDSITVNGIKKTESNTYRFSSIEKDQEVKAWFSRKPYRISITQNTPTLGVLEIEVQRNGEGQWNRVDYTDYIYLQHFDKFRLVASPNIGSKIKMLTVDGNSYTSLGEETVIDDAEIVIEFELQTFKVTAKKLTGTDRFPDKGIVTVKDVTDSYLARLDFNDTEKELLNVPYGTRLNVAYSPFEPGYGVVALDTTANGQSGSVKDKKFFIVNSDISLDIEIKQITDFYTMSWEQKGCGSGHYIEVKKADDTPISSGDNFKSGTNLSVKVIPAIGYSYYFHDAGGNREPDKVADNHTSPLSLVRDEHIVVEFVPLRTVTIDAPEYTEINVSSNGQKINSGNKIRADEELNVWYVVQTTHDDSVRSIALQMNGEDLWRYSGNITYVPLTSGEQQITVTGDCELGDIEFSGVTKVYYKVKYNPSDHGKLDVKIVGGDLLNPNKEYWLLKGTEFEITATPENNYKYEKTSYTASNTTSVDLYLEPKSTDGDVYTKKIVLNQDYVDITALFVKNMHTVTLNIEPEIVGGTVLVSDGNTQILQNSGDEQEVIDGTPLKIRVTPEAGYGLSVIKGGDQVLGLTSVLEVEVTQDTILTVVFGLLQQIFFNKDTLEVRRGDQILSNGNFVPAGSPLEVTYVGSFAEDMECKEFIATWNSTSEKYTFSDFEMPPADVRLSATPVKKRYKLEWNIKPNNIGAEIYFNNITDGGTYEDPREDILHGTRLEPIVILPEDPNNKNKTYYYINSLYYLDETGNIVNLWDKSSEGLTQIGEQFEITGNTDIILVLERRTRTLIVKVDPERKAFAVVLKVGDNPEQKLDSEARISIPVGETLTARTVIPTSNGYELKHFPNINEKKESYTGVMPHDDFTLDAKFGEKVFAVLIDIVGNGRVEVKDILGKSYVNGSQIDYATMLDTIKFIEEEYSDLKFFSISMDGSEEWFEYPPPTRVIDTVKIKAEFIYKYKIFKQESNNGSLEISCADTNAVGNFYYAGTELKLMYKPDWGYQVAELKMNGQVLPNKQIEGGETFYTIPENLRIGNLNFEVKYVPKQANIKIIAKGPGVLSVSILDDNRTYSDEMPIRMIDYFTQLSLSVEPNAGNNKVNSFVLSFEDGSVLNILDDTTIVTVEGDMIIEAVFTKFYNIVYNKPEYGTLQINLNNHDGEEVSNGGNVDAGATLYIQAQPDEGYELESLTWNGTEVDDDKIVLPEEADYDMVEINAKFKIQTKILEVVQAAEGEIVVEKLNITTGEWEALDVSTQLEIPYWTVIRARVNITLSDKYMLEGLFINEQNLEVDGDWVVKENIELTAKIVPRMYKIIYEQPTYGSLLVKTIDGVDVESDTSLPYLTELEVITEADDPIAYSVVQVISNNKEIDNETTIILEGHTSISAKIVINRWEIRSRVDGEGEIKLLHLRDDVELLSPKDSVNHYDIIKIATIAEDGWMFYSLDVFGAELKNDSSFVVEDDVDINIVFREKEPLKFPAIFTPNGDGINDIWMIEGLWQAAENKLEIFNRNEQRVYKVSPYLNDWEGTTDSGEVLPVGNYVYKFTLSSGKMYMGIIGIIRD